MDLWVKCRENPRKAGSVSGSKIRPKPRFSGLFWRQWSAITTDPRRSSYYRRRRRQQSSYTTQPETQPQQLQPSSLMATEQCKPPCQHFLAGKCTRGANCRFSHVGDGRTKDELEQTASTNIVCCHFCARTSFQPRGCRGVEVVVSGHCQLA